MHTPFFLPHQRCSRFSLSDLNYQFVTLTFWPILCSLDFHRGPSFHFALLPGHTCCELPGPSSAKESVLPILIGQGAVNSADSTGLHCSKVNCVILSGRMIHSSLLHDPHLRQGKLAGRLSLSPGSEGGTLHLDVFQTLS